MADFNGRSRRKTAEGKNKKRNTYKSVYALYEGRELILNSFRSGIFQIIFPIKRQHKEKDWEY